MKADRIIKNAQIFTANRSFIEMDRRLPLEEVLERDLP